MFFDVVRRFLVLCFLCTIMQAQAKSSLSLAVGPAWFFGEGLLVPSQSVPGQGFLAVANEETAWNLMPIVSAKGVWALHKFFSLSVVLGGGWLRFGQAALFSGVQEGGVAEFSRDFVRVNMSSNSMAFDVGAKCFIPVWCAFDLHILAGYTIRVGSQTLAFLQSPTIFFVKSKNLSPYVGIECSIELGKAELSAEYKFFAGSIDLKLTQNDSDERVLRDVRMFGNEFSASIAYTISPHCVISQTIGYDEGQNHGLGTSRVYNGARFVSKSNNVLRLQDKRIAFTTSFKYEF